MSNGILGRKIGMTQVFVGGDKVVPVTVIEAGPCVVMQKKTIDMDGYEAIQLGFGEKKEHRANKPEKGHAEKSGTTPKKFIREIRGDDTNQYELGQTVDVTIFSTGDKVDVTGISKGKGFAGVIKRHNQSRGPMAHGSRYHRRPGSMGPVAPNRVMKGKKLPGRMGGERITTQNLEVVQVIPEKNLLLIKGAIPGAKKTYVTIKAAIKQPED